MIRALGRLRWFDYLIVAIGLSVVAVAGGNGPQIAIYSAEASARWPTEISLSRNAAEAFERHFVQGGYFGAFAVGEDGAYGWTASHSSLRAARANALAYCENRGTGCRIVSELVPEGYTADPHEVTLRHRDALAFQDYLKAPGPKAFASAENGAFGVANENITIWHAMAAALAKCGAVVRQNQPDYLPDWPCEVLHASWW